MSKTTDTDTAAEYERVDPPIGWDGQTLQEMLDHSEQQLEETGRYKGLEELEMKENQPFEYEQLYSRLRGALVSARETALNISASAIVREIGELCFQLYTPEGDCVALSTGIIVHVHTGSLAIKYMIEQDYEHRRGIQPGDVFCNNDNDIGNVHTTDVHTFVPIFHDGELIAWADGVTHEIDIGGKTAGHDLIDATERFEDGLYATCEKIGENDELYQDWKERGKRGTRTPMYWDLDEKCRLAGCHMIRNTVKGMIDDVGAETFKQFMAEAVEEGRQTLNERVQERLFPGTYRDTSFMPMPFEERDHPEPAASQDMMNHLPVEMRVDTDGGLEVDMTGASPPGPHTYNAAEGSMEGGMWVSLTQCLLHDGKVNDGSYFAVDTNYPEGSVVNPQDPSLSYQASWGSIQPTYNAVWKNISRSFLARGFREEVNAGFGMTSDAVQGGGQLDATGEYWAVSTFDLSCQGLGASAARDGLDYGYAMWNPESDLGDIEKWELLEHGAVHLGRRVKPNTAGHGKYRGGSGWEGLRTFTGSSDISMFIGGWDGVGFSTTGMSGGYPYACGYTVTAQDTDFAERIAKQEKYPVDDTPPGSLEEDIEAEDVDRSTAAVLFPTQFDNNDLLHWDMRGGPGYGDPLERPVEKLVDDAEKGIYTPDVIEDVYGVVGELDEEDREFEVDEEATEARREELREEREAESVPATEFWESERERVLDREFSDPVTWMYSGVFERSPEWTESFREFWDLPADYSISEEEA
ncbi:hydantoinase B/oxoprolinase family protein [Natronomonas halophila]|uniref:hydantoinase B/oxoprolinase family protein n=1 Tax=Natronomonas halophila TaxID=2747817 RepID=UPI0015B70ECD|nr:hydantoinase B/oxoprolinase family protein [Natronomonas halophila]QLD84181.1 hydantoinase B/oxoprolinase family protein [Natronomonas halophila]